MIYVDPFLGAGGVWLATLPGRPSPPVAWMGGKRRLADRILRVLGIEPGSAPPALLGDASWWGWIWPLLLGPSGPEVCRWLRSWGGEDPRELWFRLRDAGPAEDLAERAAGLLWLQARAASGVPVWWSQAECNLVQRTRSANEYAASQSGHNLVQWTATRIDGAGQGRACAKGYHGGGLRAGARGDRPADSYEAGQRTERLFASNGRGVPVAAGHKQLVSRAGRGGGIVRTATVAERIERIRAATCGVDVDVRHEDAVAFTAEQATRLGCRARVYLDPPYQGCTGYPADCPRESVLAIADRWASAGARVAVSESEDLSVDLGAGWSSVCLRRDRRPEWLTMRWCDSGGAFGPLFARGVA